MINKYLFLLFEGLPDTVIDSQVLIHCKEMKKIGVEFEIWAFACNEKLYTKSLNKIDYAQKLSQCPVKVFKGIRPAYPFSENLNAFLVKKHLKLYRKKFDLVHARTDYSSHVASLVFDNFVWDCRGDTEAEFKSFYQSSKNLIGKLYRINKIKNNIFFSKKARKAIFVSNFLKNKYDYKKENYILGCTADSQMFYFDENLRTLKRKELGYLDSDNILVYSGGMSHYQMFAQTVELFLKLNYTWKLLVLTTDPGSAKRELVNVDKSRYKLLKLSFSEVNGYLNAADIGIILREFNDLNSAASPTKYAEYSMVGLNILHSDNIGDLDFFDNVLNNRIRFEELETYNYNLENRLNISKSAKFFLDKKSNFKEYKRIYDV